MWCGVCQSKEHNYTDCTNNPRYNWRCALCKTDEHEPEYHNAAYVAHLREEEPELEPEPEAIPVEAGPCYCGKFSGRQCFPCAELQFTIMLGRAHDGSLFRRNENSRIEELDYTAVNEVESKCEGYHRNGPKFSGPDVAIKICADPAARNRRGVYDYTTDGIPRHYSVLSDAELEALWPLQIAFWEHSQSTKKDNSPYVDDDLGEDEDDWELEPVFPFPPLRLIVEHNSA